MQNLTFISSDIRGKMKEIGMDQLSAKPQTSEIMIFPRKNVEKLPESVKDGSGGF